jgi:hypothetical protein
MAYVDERIALTEILRRLCVGVRSRFNRLKMEFDCKLLGGKNEGVKQRVFLSV